MWYWGTIIVTVILDQLSKAWILDNFQKYEVREIIPHFFNLVYVTNTGAAFSFLADVDSPWRHWFFLGIGGVAIVALTFYNRYLKTQGEKFYSSIALGCIAGGAIGNMIDRIRFGAVTDFLDFYYGSYHYPSFNLADSFICVGAGLLIVLSFFHSEPKKE